MPGLFPPGDDRLGGDLVHSTDTGVLPWQQIRDLIARKDIRSVPDIDLRQVQPASLDLRLGRRGYRVPASFLPGQSSTVMDKVEQLGELQEVDLSREEGAVIERGEVYVIELLERVRLVSGIEGKANPKSSTGRLDVLTRVITDRATSFDRIEKKYSGPLYVEVAPLTFSIRVRQGSRLTQVRFERGSAEVSQKRMSELYENGQLLMPHSEYQQSWGGIVPVSVKLAGSPGQIVGYKAKSSPKIIDIDLVGHYNPKEFWEKISDTQGRLELEPGRFYILATREDVGVPPGLAAEMVPYEATSGEFRVHYAGFFDPGFGWGGSVAGGSKAVLEVRSHGVPFLLEEGQIVGWLRYSPIATGRTEKLYGQGIRSNYQGQGVQLAKHFKPWPA